MSPHTVSHRTISLAVLVCLCCFTGLSVQCGPGRRSGRNQPRRRISPLVYKQYSPPLSEETLGASGQAEGAIQRGDVRFENLVENHNTDIIYRDEERDGSDRIMSKRCKEMLDRLAVLVQNEWPGNPPEVPPVKLKVKEAWDDKYVHGDNSLHYEGRAVDVATNDRDRFIRRCQNRGCFPKESTVEAENRGTISMADLRVGDKVLSMRADGELENSEVMSFMDRNEAGYGLFYTLYTESGNQLILTAKHLVHVSESNSSLDLSRVDVIFADNVKEGDFVLLRERDSLRMDRVIEIKVKTRQGIYAPLTKHGTILVNGIVASCYAYIDNVFIAHTVFAPMRVFHDISQYMPSFDWLNSEPEVGSVSASGDTQTGMHWYARILYNIGMLVLDADTLYVQ